MGTGGGGGAGEGRTGQGSLGCVPSPLLSDFPITKPHWGPSTSPVNVHTVVCCVHVCAVTIPLVLLCKELILVWPRAAQPLFAPQNERIINSETESNVGFLGGAYFSRNLQLLGGQKE